MTSRTNVAALYFLIGSVVLSFCGLASVESVAHAEDSPALTNSRQMQSSTIDDPWELEPPRHLATILMLPMVRDGRVWIQGDTVELHDLVTIQLYAAAIPGLTIPRAERVRSALHTMSDADADRSGFQMSDHMIGRMTEYFGGTHVIEFAVSGGSDEEHEVNIVMEKPDGEYVEATMTVGPNEQFHFAARAVGWILENSGIELEASELARARVPLWGDEIAGWNNAERERLMNDPMDAGWEKLLSHEPPLPFAPLGRLEAALRQDDKTIIMGLDPGPLGSDAHPYQRVIRSLIAEIVGNERVAEEELLLVIGSFPGMQGYVINYGWGLVKDEDKDEEFAARMQRWYNRSAKTPYEANLLGDLLLGVAWKYRGTDFIGNIPPRNLALYKIYNQRAIDVLEEAATRTGPAPWLSEARLRAWGSFGRQDMLGKIFRESWDAFPDYPNVLSITLNYLRPRWGGDHDTALDVIAFAYEERPRNPNILFQCLGYVAGEARMEQQRPGPTQVMIQDWLKPRPEWRQMMLDAADRLIERRDDNVALGVALTAYASLEESEPILDIIRANPRLYREFTWEPQYATYCLGYFAYGLAALGEWQELLDMMDNLDERVAEGESIWLRPHLTLALRIVALAHLGREQDLAARLRNADMLKGYPMASAAYARLLIGEDPDASVAPLRTGDVSEFPLTARAVRAIAEARKGKTAENSELIKEALDPDNTPSAPRYIRNELQRVLDQE